MEPKPISGRTTSSRKRSDSNDSRPMAPWCLLPGELLFSILMKLSFLDYFSFSGVCKPWRAVAKDKANALEFMKCQHPMVVGKSNHAKKAFVLHAVFGGKIYKGMLPDLTCKSFVGISCGYIIMLANDSIFCLVNLLTRHEIQFPAIPKNLDILACKYELCSVIFYSTKLSDYMMVFIDRQDGGILIAQSRGVGWVRAQNSNSDYIVDVTICDGKIYFVTCCGKFGVLKKWPSPFLQLLKTTMSAEPWCSYPKLMTSGKSIFMVWHRFRGLHIGPREILIYKLDDSKIYKLDDSKKDWKYVNDLGQNALFCGGLKCSAIVDPTKWGGGRNCANYFERENNGRNCIYRLEPENNIVTMIRLDRPSARVANINIFGAFNGTRNLVPYFWFIPHEGLERIESDEDIVL